MKKFRLLYWKMRDRGKGKQFILGVLVLFLTVTSLVGLAGRSIWLSIQNRQNSTGVMSSGDGSENDITDDITNATGSAVSVDLEDEEVMSTVMPQATFTAEDVDITGMESFLGFMSDTSYENLCNQMELICVEKECKTAKKLNYQETADGSFEVISFILLSDGSIYQSNYNLKSDVVTVGITNYTEVQINQNNEAKQKMEQEALEKKQKADKEKLEKERKEKAKKKVENNSKQKTKKKSAKKKKHKK